MFGYALLGAGWLVLKTEGELQDWARALGRMCFLGVCVAIARRQHLDAVMRAATSPRGGSPGPISCFWRRCRSSPLLIAWASGASLDRDSRSAPFVGAIALFVMSYLGIAISLWPMIVPHRCTLWQAASSPSTQAFLLVGTLFLLPVILMYTGWSVLGVPRQGPGGYRLSLKERLSLRQQAPSPLPASVSHCGDEVGAPKIIALE